MQVVPVLDIKDGLVVLARGGQRENYQAIDTPLCADPDPVAVIEAFLGLHKFTTFYIADLDAIQSRGHNDAAIKHIAQKYTDLEFWLDAGFSDIASCQRYKQDNVRLVIGSECLDSVASYEGLRREADLAQHILSLDCKNGDKLGPSKLFERAELWPQAVIAMDLGRVGENAGPGVDRLKAMQLQRTDVHFAAAGGIRDASDLVRLREADVAYALVATALHQKKITPLELNALKKNAP